MTTDINPDFLFDFGSSEAPVQAAWEFGGVLRRFAAAVEYGHGGQHAATAVILPNEVFLSRMKSFVALPLLCACPEYDDWLHLQEPLMKPEGSEQPTKQLP